MLSTYKDKLTIMKEFPITELSYEKKIYKKVSHSDFYIIIPKGEKCFAWFRQYNNYFVCMIMSLESHNKIKNIKIYTSCFKEDICIEKGTIVYGTLFTFKGNLFFSIEDIFYFLNKNVYSLSQCKKITFIGHLLSKYLKQISITKNNIIFGLPIIEKTYDKAIEMIHATSYQPFCLQHRLMNKKRAYLNEFITPKKCATFSVRCSIETDIYYLYCYQTDNSLKRYGICNIPDLHTSKMMNNLFREIKENNNLDAIEESDTEEEFENIDPGRYAHLDRVFNMSCVYKRKYRRWQPIKIDKEGEISQWEKILQIEKK